MAHFPVSPDQMSACSGYGDSTSAVPTHTYKGLPLCHLADNKRYALQGRSPLMERKIHTDECTFHSVW
jgi:hypothetical protein